MNDLKEVLSRASALVDEDATNAGTAASMVAQHIQAHFAVSRVTLWALQVEDEQRALKRMGGFDGAAQQALVEPAVLRESDLGPLFDVLVADSVYACEDTDADPRLEPLRLSRLIPDDIRASMTAPVSVNGVAVGIVSCTERGSTRRWTRQETAALRRVADEIALRHVRRIRESAHAKLLENEIPQAAGEAGLNGKGERGSAPLVEQRESGKSRT
jgi:GAF domain-containing protein